MTRAAFFALFAAGVVSVSTSRADLPVAPAPREVRPDGTRDPVPAAEPPAPKEDPREVVERIIKNSKEVGDKLARTDTGTDTRKTQAKILKDIDALLTQDDPPPKSDKSQDQKNDTDKKDQKEEHPKDKKDDMMPAGGMGEPKKDMGMGGGATPPPTGGKDDQSKGRRPRQQNSEPRKDEGKDKKGAGGGGGKEPMKDPMAGKQPKNPGGNIPEPKGDPKAPPGSPTLPWEDEVVKEVWGHLSDKLRQQATQYYKQEVLPRYAELLKHYYASLAEKK